MRKALVDIVRHVANNSHSIGAVERTSTPPDGLDLHLETVESREELASMTSEELFKEFTLSISCQNAWDSCKRTKNMSTRHQLPEDERL
eukprot:2056193-Amphidinium_carterae.2